MKPAGLLLVGALLGSAWVVPPAWAQAPGGGTAIPVPPPPPAATDLRTTTSPGAEPASPAQLQRSGVTVPGATGTFTRPAPGTNLSDSSAASMTASDPTNAAVAATLRDPFWPLDYTPGQTNAAAQAPALSNQVAAVDAEALARSLIQVQGFVRGGAQSYVMINGRMTGVGDIINIQTQGATWRFVLRRIEGRKVTIELLP